MISTESFSKEWIIRRSLPEAFWYWARTYELL